MNQDVLKIDIRDKAAVIQLNRPEVHNAIDLQVMDRLEVVQSEILSRPEIRVIILTASGQDTFCAGGDLKYFSELRNREDAEQMSARMQKILNNWWLGDRPVIAAVNGSAFGGGCELITACHIRIAARHAVFSFRQSANGIITGWGGTFRLFYQAGSRKGLQWLLTADKMTAVKAQKYGFIDEVVAAEQVLERAILVAGKISTNSTEAVRAFMQLHRTSAIDGMKEMNDQENRLFGKLWMKDDFRNWLSGFLGKSDDMDDVKEI